MTESPRRNILLMNRSLLTGVDPFFPLPVFGTCEQGSFDAEGIGSSGSQTRYLHG